MYIYIRKAVKIKLDSSPFRGFFAGAVDTQKTLIVMDESTGPCAAN